MCFDLDYAARFFRSHQKILEIGALPFFLTVPLMSKYDVTTIDKITGEYSSDIIHKYSIKTLICDLDYDTIPTEDDSFDGIIMNEIFEHLRVDLIFTMTEVLRVLRPGGILLLSTQICGLWWAFTICCSVEKHSLLWEEYMRTILT